MSEVFLSFKLEFNGIKCNEFFKVPAATSKRFLEAFHDGLKDKVRICTLNGGDPEFEFSNVLLTEYSCNEFQETIWTDDEEQETLEMIQNEADEYQWSNGFRKDHTLPFQIRGFYYPDGLQTDLTMQSILYCFNDLMRQFQQFIEPCYFEKTNRADYNCVLFRGKNGSEIAKIKPSTRFEFSFCQTYNFVFYTLWGEVKDLDMIVDLYNLQKHRLDEIEIVSFLNISIK